MAETITYADCFSGISGDMFLGALLDAGLPEEVLRDQLAVLDLTGYRIAISPKKDHSIKATQVTITAGHDQPQRSWKDIRTLIDQSSLDLVVKQKALNIFTILAQAEAKVHNCPVDEVHFHEVGAVDSIIDIVGAAIGLHHFGINQLYFSPLPITNGWVQTDHGQLPLPAPAVCEILEDVPVYGVELKQELVTPTGAALAKALGTNFGPFPSMIIKKVGYGAGSHALPNRQPNLFRLVIGQSKDVAESQHVEVIETHIDDWSPEGFPYLSEQLFAQGALDVALVPIQMKKGRPGFLLRVIAVPAHSFTVKQCILSETTAIGLRYRIENRWTLPREQGTVATRFGKVKVKKVETPAGTRLYPEYEDCKRIAHEQQIPLTAVYREAACHTEEDFSKD